MASVESTDCVMNFKNGDEKARQKLDDKVQILNNLNFAHPINTQNTKKTFYNDCKSIRTLEKTIVTDEHVQCIIKEIMGENLSMDSHNTKEKIVERLSKCIIGQQSAVERVANALIRNFAGINPINKPRGVFLFVGESGVGKTKLAHCLTEELFGSDNSLIRYDMSEFSESSAVTKLLGASPGYIGYDDQNSPIERVRKHPYSVVLFDEIEKAHPDVLSLFLQIFEEGFLTDAVGRKISFRNTYIIMTSNVGADSLLRKKSPGFINPNNEEEFQGKLREYFKEEFLNRIDEVVVFAKLDISALKEIAKMKISLLSERISKTGIDVEFDNDVCDYLAKKAINANESGARKLDRIIVTLIENKIASMMVDGEIKPGESVRILKHKDEIQCVKKVVYALK
ncbi:MAG: ATP-dependent Clp protease ATP-binding subunit [Ruminococcaceae bacterium]|nr:ATP-dependent Clp protease ATP-binding subunit [Oscillospiraceae bacterium]